MSDNTNNNNMNMNGVVSKAKTRMCNNLNKGGPCPYGKKCHFAHDASELQVQVCGFGDKCVFVGHDENGNVFNSPNSCKVCRFMHPSESEAGYAKRLYNSLPTTTPVTFRSNIGIPRKTNMVPVKLDLSEKKPIMGNGWTNIQSKKNETVNAPCRVTTEMKKSMNSFSAIADNSEHIVTEVNVENLFDHLDEWGDDDVKDIKLTVNYEKHYNGAKVFEPNPGYYEEVAVPDFSKF